MSKQVLEQQLEKDKEMNVLKECVKVVDEASKKLTEETKTVIYAKIEPVGAPTLNMGGSPEKRVLWKFWKNGKKEKEQELRKTFERWQNICKENGVIPMARITDFGARIEYALTPEKKTEISKIITPPENKELIIP